MRLGIYGINLGPCVDPEIAARVARAAEAAGFDSLWTAEHVVLPDPQVPPSPVPPETPLLDPAVALAFIAGQTRTIRLATGIVILPQRNPVVLAKEFASLDRVSGGRLILGVAAGYLQAEFEALGIPFADRGARTDEYIEVIRELWTRDRPRFDGRFFSFAGIQSQPRPLQQPHPPIVIGGQSPAALARAVRRGDGWYGFALDLGATARLLAGLEDAARAWPRGSDRAPLEISVTPNTVVDRDAMRRYEDLGVHRLVLIPFARDADGLLAFVEKTAETLRPA